jgi:hypothetical protein
MAETDRLVLCDLETYLCPPTVLFKGQDQRRTIVQLGSGSGEEQHPSTRDPFCRMSRSGSRGLIKRTAQGS